MRDRFVTSRYIPKGSMPITEDDLGTVYVYRFVGRDGKPRYGAVAYLPKAIRNSWHYTFKTDLQLDSQIENWFKNLRAHKALVAERRAKQFAGHNFKVGDIVTNSWGYDQTNVDWYIVKRVSKSYVWLKGVSSELVTDEGCGPMSGVESLRLDENLKPIESEKPATKHQASGDYVTMRHGCGTKWTGDKKYSSWYA